MKGKDIIDIAVRTEMPNMEEMRENCIRIATERPTQNHSIWAKRFVPAIACIALLLAVSIAYPHFVGDRNLPDETKDNLIVTSSISTQITETSEISDNIFRGLPTENFSLADVTNDSTMCMDRIAFDNFGTFFQYGNPYFIIVKVTDTQTLEAEYETERVEKFGEEFDIQKTVIPQRQISELQILKNVYGECESESIQITQYNIDHFCLGKTNLLREDGVYLLPLHQYEGDWSIMGDMDVLFEIDDEGIVWSHSDWYEFNKYDGKNVEYFISVLENMFSDDDFLLANSPFAKTLQNWTLADIEILSVSDEKFTDFGYDITYSYLDYEYTANEVFSVPRYGNAPPIKNIEYITVYADSGISLSVGKRYLIFLDRYINSLSYDNNNNKVDEIVIRIDSNMIAEINDDNTITAIGDSVFAPYNGYTINDMRDLVSRISLWH